MNTNRIAAAVVFLFCLIIICTASWLIATGEDSGAATTEAVIPETRSPPPEETPPYYLETHQNGYCGGYCHESVCPFFTGYPMIDWWETLDAIPLDAEMQQYIYDASQQYGVDMALLLGLIECESHFRPYVYGDSGRSYGLMQINRINYDCLRAEGIEPLEYPGNIDAGALMIGRYLDKYGDTHRALMAYNGGETYARRLWNDGTRSTAFSRAVTQAAEEWKTILQGGSDHADQ